MTIILFKFTYVYFLKRGTLSAVYSISKVYVVKINCTQCIKFEFNYTSLGTYTKNDSGPQFVNRVRYLIFFNKPLVRNLAINYIIYSLLAVKI